MQDATSKALTIDTLSVPGASGSIGMCACPGGRRAHSVDYDPTLDLTQDLETIRAFGARTLVTLMEERELHLLGVQTLPMEARRMGLQWMHLPIIDMSAPTAVFENRWILSGPELHASLLQGENVVLHCWAGLGRTGTIAAKLLVEFGMDPASATRAVRASRSGTIQSRQQEKYVKKLKAR